jgi:hemerythrin-like metal-binding protein
MTFVSWKKSYAVGTSTVDEQHQQLFSLLNRVEGHVRGGSSKLDVDRVVSELEDYTKFHFNAEERTLEGMGGTEMAEHQTQHSYFVTEIAKMRHALQERKVVDPRSLVVFLRDWLVHHILEVDKQAFHRVAATVTARQGQDAAPAAPLHPQPHATTHSSKR